MKETTDQTISSSNTAKDNPETPMTLERALDLLGLSELPEGNLSTGQILCAMTRMEKRYGEAYMRKNRKYFQEELEYTQNF